MALPNIFNKSLRIYRDVSWQKYCHMQLTLPSKLGNISLRSVQSVIPFNQPVFFHQSVCHQIPDINSAVCDQNKNGRLRRVCGDACVRLFHDGLMSFQNKDRWQDFCPSENHDCSTLLPNIQRIQNDKRLPHFQTLVQNSYCVLVSGVRSFSTSGKQCSSHDADTSSAEESGMRRSGEKGVSKKYLGHISLESEEDLTRLAEDIKQEARTRDVMVDTVPLHIVEQLILDLHNSGFLPSHIASLLSSHPFLLLHHRSVLPAVHRLLNHGLDPSQVMTLLHGFPGAVKVSATRVEQTVDALRTGHFQEHSIGKIFARNPSVLLVTAAKLTQRLGMLRQLFKSADVVALVVDCPQMLTDEWEGLQAKFDYVFHEMKITQRQMVYASIFAHPLSHIQQRHAFLVRAGFFSMAKRRDGEKNPNARLDQIISSSNQAFCRRFGGFDVAEYRAFCLLYDREKLEEEDSESESDMEKA